MCFLFKVCILDNLEILNNLEFDKPDKKRFPGLLILKKITNLDTLFETALISANDELVNQFLQGKIKFYQIIDNLNAVLRSKSLKLLYKKKPFRPSEIAKLCK